LDKKSIPYGYILGNKIFLESWGENPEREIGEIKENDEAKSIEYFVTKYDSFKEKIDTLESKVNSSENQGSFQMQIQHLMDKTKTHDGLGDYFSIYNKLEKILASIQVQIKKNRGKNADIKKALLLELKEAVDLVSWKESSEKIKDIKQRWIKTGTASEDINQILEDEFQDILNSYYERRNAFFEDKKRLSQHYENIYEEIVAKAKSLKNLDPKEVNKREEELKSEWKENGPVDNETYVRLNSEFQKALKAYKFDSQIEIEPLFRKYEDIVKSKELKVVLNFKEEFSKLKSIKSRDKVVREKRAKAFELLYYLQELSFLYNSCLKRKKGFDKLDIKQQKKEMKTVLSGLLERDKTALKNMENNSFTIKDENSEIKKLLDSQLLKQNQKIKIKETIFKELK